MRILAYCCERFAESTRQAAGVKPITCPPVDCASFDLRQLEGQDFIWFDLHGEPGAAWWLGDDGSVAMTAAQLREVDLGGAIVFAVNCYLADDNSPMLDALLEAGARYVVGGSGRNWGGERTLMGAGLLGMRFRQLLEREWDPMVGLAVAKQWLMLSAAADQVMGKGRKTLAAKDALEFRAFYRHGV